VGCTQASRSGGSLEDVIVTHSREIPPFTLNFSGSIALSNACNTQDGSEEST